MFRNEGLKRIRCARLATVGVSLIALIAAAGAGAKDETPEGWTGEAALSVTAQSGSVDTFAGAVDMTADREWTEDVVGVRFSGVYGTSKDRDGLDSKNETIQNSQGLYGDWRHTIHERFFWNTADEVSRDSTQDREVRVRLVTGPGYRTWEGEEPEARHFDVTVGMGYRYELYDGNNDVDPAVNVDGSDQNLADVVAGFEYKNKLFGDRILWTHTGSAAVPVNKPEAYLITTEAIAGVPLTEAWNFRTGIFYEYVNDVPDDRNPSTLRVTIGLGYKF
jgi:hypothetical protein